jgi:hypothetical protein
MHTLDRPRDFAQLAAVPRESMLSSLLFGVTHHDADVAAAGLAALRAVAVYHVNATAADANINISAGGGDNNNGGGGGRGSPFAAACVSFQSALFQLVLLSPVAASLLDAIADALLPLIVSSHAAYTDMAGRFIGEYCTRAGDDTAATGGGGDAAAAAAEGGARARLSRGFEALLTDNGVDTSLTRANGEIFRKNLRAFVLDVRSFVQQK